MEKLLFFLSIYKDYLDCDKNDYLNFVIVCIFEKQADEWMGWGVSLYRRQLVEPNFQINQTLLCIARTIDALQALFGLLIQRWSIFRAHFPGTLDRPLASHRCPVSLNVVYNMLHSLDV
ncbi:hypothetical protein T07_14654 [Trichinella nelsoni]|uniref:Uncharacterized protein n=2 Tax=Trichinella TaxID=6333 RepID=A0A0V0RX00_9BILA|nr:hypothetical protein T07_14654 [Trichinella nelsoni]